MALFLILTPTDFARRTSHYKGAARYQYELFRRYTRQRRKEECDQGR